jgi:LysM repeat protein
MDLGAPASGSLTPDDTTVPSATSANPSATTATRTVATRTAKARTHTVAAGETLASIARKSGVSLTALQAANPGVTPKKLKVGQVLNVPAP